MKEKSQNLYRVTDIEVNYTSALLTSFDYYDSLDNIEILRELNTNLNPAAYSGDIKIIS
jgi:hypothetical protein